MALLAMCAVLGANAVRADHAATQAAPVDEDIQNSDAEPHWRWIAERAERTVRLSAVATLDRTAVVLRAGAQPGRRQLQRRGPIPPGLEEFLLLRDPPDLDVPPGATAALQTLAGLASIEPDPMGVAGFGSALQDETWQALATNFKQQTGRPNAQPFVPLVPMPLVRLAVVNTQPTSDCRCRSDAAQRRRTATRSSTWRTSCCATTAGDCAARIAARPGARLHLPAGCHAQPSQLSRSESRRLRGYHR